MQGDVDIVAQAPKLGTLPGVSEIASFTQSVGGDGQGASEAVKSLKATLQQMYEAYVKASTDYQETNTEIADAMNRLGQNGSSSSTSAAPAATTAPTNSGPKFSA